MDFKDLLRKEHLKGETRRNEFKMLKICYEFEHHQRKKNKKIKKKYIKNKKNK